MKAFTLSQFQDEIFGFKKDSNGEKVRILFTTYNSVSGYPSGRVDTHKDTIEIFVENGNMPRNPIIPIGFMMVLEHPRNPIAQAAMRQAHALMHKDGENAQDKVVAQATKVLDTCKENLFIVVYVGVSGFDPALQFIRKLDEDYPSARIIAVSCNCNRPHSFEPVRDQLDMLVITSECGGRDTMKEILESFCHAW